MEQWQLPTTWDSLTINHLPTLEKAGSASDIFGTASTLNPELLPHSEAITTILHPAQAWQNSVFVLVLMGYYIFILYRYLGVIGTVFRVSLSISNTINVFRQKNNEQKSLIVHSKLLLVFALSSVVNKFCLSLSQADYLVSFLVILGSTISLFVVQFLVRLVARLFSDDHASFENLGIINSHSIQLAALIFTPVAIAIGISSNPAWSWALAIAAAVWIYYIIRLLALFILCGFGKLQWFLYLCTAQILPVSYLASFILR